MFQTADFAITDLTITAARQKAVDFTSPFMNLGITILYKKPTKQPPNLYSFISPFSYEVKNTKLAFNFNHCSTLSTIIVYRSMFSPFQIILLLF